MWKTIETQKIESFIVWMERLRTFPLFSLYRVYWNGVLGLTTTDFSKAGYYYNAQINELTREWADIIEPSSKAYLSNWTKEDFKDLADCMMYD